MAVARRLIHRVKMRAVLLAAAAAATASNESAWRDDTRRRNSGRFLWLEQCGRGLLFQACSSSNPAPEGYSELLSIGPCCQIRSWTHARFE